MKAGVAVFASLMICAIAGFQTVTNGAPDPYTLAALAALSFGGGAGKATDALITKITKPEPAAGLLAKGIFG